MSELLDQLSSIYIVRNIVIFSGAGFIICETEEGAELVCVIERLVLLIELLQ